MPGHCVTMRGRHFKADKHLHVIEKYCLEMLFPIFSCEFLPDKKMSEGLALTYQRKTATKTDPKGVCPH